jgi:peroxiredoxin
MMIAIRFACATVALLLSTSALAAPEVGKSAPSFALRDRSGALLRLADLAYPGAARPHRPKHALLLDFFRTDCKPCRKGIPKLVKLHAKYKGKGLKVVLIALLEDDEGQQKLDAFLAKHRLPFTVLIDAYGVAGKKYVRKGNGFSIPATFLIDSSGVLRMQSKSPDEGKLSPLLAKVLK